MKPRPIMTPQDIIETINRIFDEAIIVTDVGQHQMFVSQFAEITEKKRLLMSGGLGTMGYGFREPSVQRSAIRIYLSSLFPVTAESR